MRVVDIVVQVVKLFITTFADLSLDYSNNKMKTWLFYYKLK